MPVGQRLAQARIAKKLTQEELATHCGITSHRLSRIERNKADPRVSEISALCDTLDISADWWLRDEHNPHARLHNEIDNLSQSQATVLCVMFDFILHDRHEQAYPANTEKSKTGKNQKAPQ